MPYIKKDTNDQTVITKNVPVKSGRIEKVRPLKIPLLPISNMVIITTFINTKIPLIRINNFQKRILTRHRIITNF